MDNIIELPDGYHIFRVKEASNSLAGVKMSEYITLVKARKIIRSMSEVDVAELNESVFGVHLNKFNKWTKEKLLSKLEFLDHAKLMRFLYVREKESLMDALMCLLGKKKFNYDANFLTNFFKYGTALNGRSK
jgi:hypothetical protein